jgi:hypothetical protein
MLLPRCATCLYPATWVVYESGGGEHMTFCDQHRVSYVALLQEEDIDSVSVSLLGEDEPKAT